MSAKKHELFIVGRISKGEHRLVFVHTPALLPFPGPFELRAIFLN